MMRVGAELPSGLAIVRRTPLVTRETGSVFNARIGDWPVHLDKACALRSSVTPMAGHYKATPGKTP